MIHTSGRVSVVLNIVDGRDGHVQLDVGSNVNDGAWHRVEIKRNRMETTLLVDTDTDSRFAFGSDFNFGDLRTNSEVGMRGSRTIQLKQIILRADLECEMVKSFVAVKQFLHAYALFCLCFRCFSEGCRPSTSATSTSWRCRPSSSVPASRESFATCCTETALARRSGQGTWTAGMSS